MKIMKTMMYPPGYHHNGFVHDVPVHHVQPYIMCPSDK